MFVFDQALGQVCYYGQLIDPASRLILVPLEVSTVIDDDLRTNWALDDVLSTTGITESSAGRITATSAWTDMGKAYLDNPGWLGPPAGPQITRILVCYSPTTTSPDSDIIPLVSLDVDFTPDAHSDLMVNLADNGYYEATGYIYV